METPSPSGLAIFYQHRQKELELKHLPAQLRCQSLLSKEGVLFGLFFFGTGN